jgi:hypothetical protein
MTTNNKISNLIGSQVPFFVKNDHQNFVRFIEAYYEFLEQNDGLIDRAKNLRSYQDIDRSLGDFEQELYDTYLKLIPENVIVDKRLLLKNVKDFYLSKGSEKSIRFLLNILYGEQNVEFYYPKKDVLRASDGKWYIQKSLRVNNLFVNGTANSSLFGLGKFVNRIVRGNTSNATATVESIDRFFEKGTQVNELTLINILGEFVNGEQVFSLFDDEGGIKSVTANVFGAIVNSVTITNAGRGYVVGTHPIIESDSGTGANVRIDRVTTGNIASITVIDGGAGYQNNIYTLISGGGGSGANAQVSLVLNDSSIHPNSYNISFSTISLETNTPINNTRYSNLNTSIVASPNANTRLVDAFQFFVYGNTGPVRTITVLSSGTNYTSVPSINLIANTRIKELQILGRMKIVNGGLGYAIGDRIEFINPTGGYGTGAAANVSNVAANGRITGVRFISVPGHIVGGSGYNVLPSANVITSTGNGAVITVTARLGEGGEFVVANTTLGAIQQISILERGSGYTSPPTINLQSLGDGTATANASIIEGVFTYPGRYLNDDGFLSSYNFLQDRDYYQNFSYVLRLRQSIANYRKAIKDLVHPSGTKLFGAYLIEDEAEDVSYSAGGEDSIEILQKLGTYLISNNAIINYTDHGLSVNDEVTIQFTSGNIANFAANVSTYSPNSIYRVANVINANAFTIFSGKYLPGSINVTTLTGEVNPTDIYMKEDGYDLFFISTTSDRVFDYKLRRQYDITSAYLDKRSPSLAIEEPGPTALTFKPDGTIFYITGTTNDRITQYNMSEAWNVSTATIGLSFNVSNAFSITSPHALQLSRDGSYLYFVDQGTDIVYQLQLSEAWNVNTASYLTQRNVITFESSVTGLYFNSNGTSMFIGGGASDRVREFRLSTAWNVNTATIYSNSAAFTAFSPSMQGITFANNGSMLYIVDSTYDLIHQLPMTEAWTVNTAFNDTTTTGNVIVGLVV